MSPRSPQFPPIDALYLEPSVRGPPSVVQGRGPISGTLPTEQESTKGRGPPAAERSVPLPYLPLSEASQNRRTALKRPAPRGCVRVCTVCL